MSLLSIRRDTVDSMRSSSVASAGDDELLPKFLGADVVSALECERAVKKHTSFLPLSVTKQNKTCLSKES